MSTMLGPFAASQGVARGAAVTSPEPDTESVIAQRRVRLDVPISHPRYERKTRLNRAIAVTDSGASEPDTGRSPSELLSMRSRESLHVRHGPVRHEEAISYRAFACFKHGSRRVHTQSVGYSSDGDLVLMRRDVSEASDSGANSLRRSALAVDAAVCLNPQARPTDATIAEDADGALWQRKLARMKKYPGVKCPKNRKVRNRLMNDHFATAAARALYDAADTDEDPDGLKAPAPATFEPLPPSLSWLIHTDEEAQTERMSKLGLDIGRFGLAGAGGTKPVAKQVPKSLDSAAFRFAQLQTRMKGELQHAMSTEYMPRFIDELEGRIEALISADADAMVTNAPTSIEVECRDGYGRLITHGVAAFYKLTSQSVDADGRRVTLVSLPKKRVPLPDQRLAPFLLRPASRSPQVSPAPPPVLVEYDGGDVSNNEESNQLNILLRRKRFKKRTLRRQMRDWVGAAAPRVSDGR